MCARAICARAVERVRVGRSLHHRMESTRAFGAGGVARVRRAILAAGPWWPDVPPPPTGDVRGGLDSHPWSPGLVSRDEPALACGAGGNRNRARFWFPLSRRERGPGGEDSARRRADLCGPPGPRGGGRQRHRARRIDGCGRCVPRRVRRRRPAKPVVERRGSATGIAEQGKRGRGARIDRRGLDDPTCSTPAAATDGRICSELVGDRRRVPRRTRRCSSSVRSLARDGARLPRRERHRGTIDGSGGLE